MKQNMESNLVLRKCRIIQDRCWSFPQTVPEGCIFVLGDNRAVSEDSRYKIVGMIDERNILGKAVFNIFPFSKIGPAN